jgi:agmatine/peptidylarginine deiminase
MVDVLHPQLELRLHEIGRDHRSTAAPPGVVRNPAEWEPSEGVLVRWPLGIPISLVAEMSEDVMVTTIVANASQEQSASSAYTSGGVNMANVQFVHAPTNTIYTRDYGPWFIFDDLSLAIVDPIYNRPRPQDDVIPQVIGGEWGLDVFGMDLIHTGGNHMSDGLGLSASTKLVYNENPGKTQAEIHQLMLDYLGNDYTVLEYIQSGGIHHIDCWAKFLGPSTVLVKDVAPTDSTYDELNERAEFLSQQISPWGVPYTVLRVFCPSGTWYTNSLILNDKVLVPLFGGSYDDDALLVYQQAMPGYEVLGYSGSWASEDALHCRTMGVPDRGMLRIDHVPFTTEAITQGDYEIGATIVAHSGEPLRPGELGIQYSVDGGPWQEAPLTSSGADSYLGYIPAQPEDSVVSYYLQASDESGRVETHPYIGEPWAHRFTTICPGHPLVDVTPDGPAAICSGNEMLLTADLVGGTGPFTYQWLVDGIAIPGATAPTYQANASGTRAYNCRVWGAGCIRPRTDAEDVELTWQAAPVFGGLTAVTNPHSLNCTLDVAWDAATPACAGPVYYDVYRSTEPGFTPGPENLLIAGLAGTTHGDQADLDFGTQYHYVVRAMDDSNGAADANLVELSGSPTGPSGGTSTLFADAFEDPVAWTDWSVTTGPGPHTCGAWNRVGTSSQRPPGSTGFYALADSDACGSGSTTSTDLVSPIVDCDIAGLSSVTLEYDLYYRYWDGDDASVEVYDGSDWQAVWSAPGSTVQAHHTLDVTAHAVGNPDFRIRFRYQNAAYDYWFAVDNVVLTGVTNSPCATTGACTMTVNVRPNGTTSVCDGDDIVFTATPNGGVPPYDYQWTEDGVDVSGATSSTFVVQHATAQSHTYNCRVGDAGLCSDVADGLEVTGEWTTCSAVVTVPDGSEDGTDPLRVGKSQSDLAISWDVTTLECASPGYHLIWGWGHAVDAYVVSGADCSLDASGSHLWTSSPDTSADWSWFIVVGNDGATTEGGWGTDSSANQRSTSASGECGTLTVDLTSCIP